MNSIKPSILVIGIGNEYRGDDGVGILAARHLRGRLPTEAQIIESLCADPNLVETWRLYHVVIIIDAVLSGAPIGTIYRFDACSCTPPPQFCNCSSHAFGLVDAIELARVMDWLPQKLIVYGIETKEFRQGSAMSKEVAHAMPILVDRVSAELSMPIGGLCL